MDLYILRHGIAVEPGTPGYENDADRPLTPEGQRKLEQIADGTWFDDEYVVFNRFHQSSPSPRIGHGLDLPA